MSHEMITFVAENDKLSKNRNDDDYFPYCKD